MDTRDGRIYTDDQPKEISRVWLMDIRDGTIYMSSSSGPMLPDVRLSEMYEEGKSLRSIGELIGFNTTLVFRLFRRLSLKTDPKRRVRRPGSRIIRGKYIWVSCPSHPRANYGGYVREHILMMEAHLERYLEPHERVHHKDGDGHHNVMDNFELKTDSGHKSYHANVSLRDNKGRFIKKEVEDAGANQFEIS